MVFLSSFLHFSWLFSYRSARLFPHFSGGWWYFLLCCLVCTTKRKVKFFNHADDALMRRTKPSIQNHKIVFKIFFDPLHPLTEIFHNYFRIFWIFDKFSHWSFTKEKRFSLLKSSLDPTGDVVVKKFLLILAFKRKIAMMKIVEKGFSFL